MKREVGIAKEEAKEAEEAGQEAIRGGMREEEPLSVAIRGQIWGVRNGGRTICVSQFSLRTN